MPDVLDFAEEKKPVKPARQQKEQQPRLNTPQRNNNPGNLRDPKTKAFRAFGSPQEGWHALRNDLTAKITGNTQTGLTPASTLRDLAAVYAPRSDKNDPDNWAQQVAGELKVTPDTKIGKLNDKVDQFARAVAGAEGWFEGRRRRHPVPQTAPPPGAKPSGADLFEDFKPKPAAAAPAMSNVEQPDGQKPPEAPHEKHSWYSTSIVEALTGNSLTEQYERGLKWVNQNVPWMGNSRAVQFTEELSKMIPGVGDFLTSPVGAGVALMNLVPEIKPLAQLRAVAPLVPAMRVASAAIDTGFGMQSAAQAIFSVPHIIADPSPKNLAEATAAAIGAYFGVKGGRKHWKKAAPDFHAAPLIERMKIREAAKEAAPEDKAKVLESFVPKTTAERVKAAIYRHPSVRDLASMAKAPMPKLLQVAQDVVNKKVSFEQDQVLRRNFLAYHLKEAVPAAELAIERGLGDVIQGTEPPSILSDAGRAALENIRAFERENVEMFRHAYGDDIPLQDAGHYLGQMFDMKDLAKKIAERKGEPAPLSGAETAKRVSGTLMKDPHLRAKKMPNYKYAREVGIDIDGENYKLKPLYDNVIDVITKRHEIATKAIANLDMANTWRQMGMLLSESEAEKLGLSHWKSAPEAPALYRATYGGKTPSGEQMMRMKPPKVHPNIEMPVNSSFGQWTPNTTLAALEAYRAAGKTMALAYSFFHPQALSGEGVAIHMLRSNPIKTLQQLWFANPEYLRGARTGLFKLVGKQTKDKPPVMRIDPALTRGWVKDNLNMSLHTDAEPVIVKQLQQVGKDMRLAGRAATSPLRLAGRLAHASDIPLWDYYHPSLMVTSAETILVQEMKRLGPNATPVQITEVRQAIAEHVNNVYGAISWERLMLSPRARFALNFFLMAPKWTTSNLRAVTQGLENEMGERLVKKYLAGAALSWFLTTQMANFALTGWFGNRDKNGVKRAHFTWDNAGIPLTVGGKRIANLNDNALNFEAGYYEKKSDGSGGQVRVFKTNKNIRELMGWAIDPLQTYGGKMSLPMRAAFVLLGGVEPGSGYKVIDMQKDSFTAKLLKRIEYAVGITLPFGVHAVEQNLLHKELPQVFQSPNISSGFAGIPSAKGMTLTKAAIAYGMAVDDGNEAVAQEILQSAVINHIDPHKVVQIYRTDATKRRKRLRETHVIMDTHGNPVGQTAPPPAARDSKPSGADLFQ